MSLGNESTGTIRVGGGDTGPIVFDHIKGEVRHGGQRYMPLSARHSRRKRLKWHTKNGRQRVALWLAPWLRTWGD